MYAFTEAYWFHLGSACEVARPSVVISCSEHVNAIFCYSLIFPLIGS